MWGRKRRFRGARLPRRGPPSFLQRTDDLHPKRESAGDPRQKETRAGGSGERTMETNRESAPSSPPELRMELQPRKPLRHGE